jgi:uncharacterized membrane protein YecN with MAPEG domain
MPMTTALYAGLLGLIWIGIAFVAGRTRGSTGISMGDGGNVELIVAMRRHANFVESVPLVLILIGLLEMNGVGLAAIHGLGATFVVARVLHAVGMRSNPEPNPLRVVGAVGTTLVIAISSVWAIATAL